MSTLDARSTRTKVSSTEQSRPARFWPERSWRVLLIASGALMLIGGSMHPDAPADLGLRDELALMMDDDAWVPGHALLLVATALLAVGLWRVRRVGAWSTAVQNALHVAMVAFGLYTVETFFHLISFVDIDRLRDGSFAPIAFTHLALAAVLYPASGLALAWLAWRLRPTWSLAQQPFAIAGIIGGIAHAVSVPATLTFANTEVSWLFAVSGVTIALWAIAAGLVGVRTEHSVPLLEHLTPERGA